jgi:hypothetical protein
MVDTESTIRQDKLPFSPLSSEISQKIDDISIGLLIAGLKGF